MPADPETLTREYERLKAERTPWESTWDALAQTCLPAGAGIGTTGRAGQKQTSELFDNTGLDSAAMLASHLMGSVTNFQTQWFSLRMRQKGLNDQREVGVWLDTLGVGVPRRGAPTSLLRRRLPLVPLHGPTLGEDPRLVALWLWAGPLGAAGNLDLERHGQRRVAGAQAVHPAAVLDRRPRRGGPRLL